MEFGFPEKASAKHQAYEVASHRIDLGMRRGAGRLSFSDLPALEKLPESISKMSNLVVLGLENTSISDLSVLAGLRQLKEVFLSRSAVSNLEPLLTLSNVEVLHLDATPLRDLSPLWNLRKLRELGLRNTKPISLEPLGYCEQLATLYLSGSSNIDLSGINGLPIRSLTLDHSDVENLRPILRLPLLGKSKDSQLKFHSTPAAKSHPQLERIARLGDYGEFFECAKQTRLFLETDPSQNDIGRSNNPTTPPPQQEPSLDFIWTPDGFALNSTSVRIDDDPVATATRDDLLDMISELCRQSGNHHEDIYRRAENLRQRLEAPKIDRLRIHIAFQRLQRLYDKRASREDKLDSDVEATLQDVVETLPGLTLADEKVRDLLERQAKNRADRIEAAQTEAEIGVLNAVTADDAPFDDEAQDLAKDASDPETDDQLTRSRPMLAWNAIVAVGQEFQKQPVATTGGLLAAAASLSPPIEASAPWLVAHADEILIAARIWGAEFVGWINPIIGQARAITDAINARRN